MNLCVFQGTFNPIHNAHIDMANYVLDNYDFDNILFIPAYMPVHKDYDLKMCQHRFNMVKLAISDNDRFKISDIEYKLNQKSYTYYTILELYKIYDLKNKIKFIIGTDAFEKIETWHRSDELKKLVEFIVFTRENELNKNKYDYLKEKGYVFEFAKMDYIEISSTDARKNLDEQTQILPEKVKGYIIKNELY
ncbi:MAG: nicotinate (nicotinamide) nucleotide adenylyltransferase [Candidatus Gastranaerophilales bacterium]